VKIWTRVQNYLPNWSSIVAKTKNAKNDIDSDTNNATKHKKNTMNTEADVAESTGDKNIALARESLSQLLDDSRVPISIRNNLKAEYTQVKSMLDKLENGHIHIAVFGRVSVGKSSVLNALIGKTVFSTSILHGETKTVDMQNWAEYHDGGVYLFDTPGINEIDGEDREAMAHNVAERVDLVLFVVDSDLTDVNITDRSLKISKECGTIVPGDSCELKGAHVVTESDVVRGKVTNVASAVSNETRKRLSVKNVAVSGHVSKPDMSITKTAGLNKTVPTHYGGMKYQRTIEAILSRNKVGFSSRMRRETSIKSAWMNKNNTLRYSPIQSLP